MPIAWSTLGTNARFMVRPCKQLTDENGQSVQVLYVEALNRGASNRHAMAGYRRLLRLMIEQADTFSVKMASEFGNGRHSCRRSVFNVHLAKDLFKMLVNSPGAAAHNLGDVAVGLAPR